MVVALLKRGEIRQWRALQVSSLQEDVPPNPSLAKGVAGRKFTGLEVTDISSR